MYYIYNYIYLKFELRIFPIINSHWHFILMEIIKRTSL